MFLRIVTIVFPVFAIVALGFLYGRHKRPEMAIANQINMDVFLPALIFHIMANRDFHPEQYLMLAAGGTIVILGSGLLALPVARWLGYPWKTFVPPMMFTNYGNLGLPLFLLAFGESSLSAAVVLFIVGTLLHFTLGRYLLDHRVGLLRLVKNPILVATALGLMFSLFEWRLPLAVAVPIEMIGQVSIPLLLFSLGVRLTHIDWGDWRIGLSGAVVCPVGGLIIALGVAPLLDLSDAHYRQLLLFGALPPAVLNFLFAEQFNQEPRKVAAIVMMGNLASVLVIPLMLAWLLPET